ncbi:MAG: 1-phosphofructokinase [Acetivibrio ethanolgignens]
MIYTVTINPSIDYIVSVENFELGRVNRTSKELVYPGGKGVNVSLVLMNLGKKSTALGFVAGFTGAEIENSLKDWGCFTDFISVKQGMSRINLKLRAKEETEINGQGPKFSSEDLEKLYRKLDCLENGDVLILAGSIPGTLPASIYQDIMARLKEKDIRVVVDATGDLLVNVLKYRPFLIKPNNHELGEIFGVKLQDKEEVITYAKKLQEMGARNVLISMAGDGAVLVAEDGSVLKSEAPKGKVVNSVGAGDSMVAGFITGYLEKGDYKHAFYTGIAAGSASAFSERLATKDEVRKIYEELIASNERCF